MDPLKIPRHYFFIASFQKMFFNQFCAHQLGFKINIFATHFFQRVGQSKWATFRIGTRDWTPRRRRQKLEAHHPTSDQEQQRHVGHPLVEGVDRWHRQEARVGQLKADDRRWSNPAEKFDPGNETPGKWIRGGKIAKNNQVIFCSRSKFGICRQGIFTSSV